MGNVKSLFMVPPPTDPTDSVVVPQIEGCIFLVTLTAGGKTLNQSDKVKFLMDNWENRCEGVTFFCVDWHCEPCGTGVDEKVVKKYNFSFISPNDAKEMLLNAKPVE